jgi:hypothetical protein
VARKITIGADWDAMRPWLEGGRLRLWSRFPVEIAPDLIVTPLLFLTDGERAKHGHACTLPPHGLVVLHGRGDEHVCMLLEEVAPRLRHLPFAFVVDADARVLHPAGEQRMVLRLEELPSILRRVVIGYAPDELEPVIERFTEQQREAVERLPTKEDAEAFRALPEIQERIAAAVVGVERCPLRLWEAMLFRGENYRWELVSGEVPLIGELFSPLAANRTVLSCVADAEHAFGQRATERAGWITCGPMRMRQRGTCVEIRFRPSPADRRAAFLPRAELAGDDELPSLWGALIAGGGKGKTEMIAGYTDSVIQVHPSASPERVAHHLAAEVRRITGAEVSIFAPTADGDPADWPDEPGDEWRVSFRQRWVSVWMPIARDGAIAWDIHAGLHLSDDFRFWQWRREAERTKH